MIALLVYRGFPLQLLPSAIAGIRAAAAAAGKISGEPLACRLVSTDGGSIAGDSEFVVVHTMPMEPVVYDAIIVLRPAVPLAVADAAINNLRARNIPVLEFPPQLARETNAPARAAELTRKFVSQLIAQPRSSRHLACLSDRPNAQRTAQQLFAEAMALMRETIAQPLTIGEIAQRLATSQKQLTRVFHANTGEAPLVHYRRLRVEAGVRRIRETEDSITEIAHASGFADLPHFIRSVKEFTGRTPNSFRRPRPNPTALGTFQAPQRVLRVGCPFDRSYNGYASLKEFSNRLELRTSGRIRFEVVPFRSVGLHSAETLRAVTDGRFDVVLVVPEYCHDEPLFRTVVPQGILVEPGTNLDIAHPQDSIVTGILARHGLGVLARLNDLGQRHIFLASRTPVTTLEDLRQLTVQLWSNVTAHAFARLGIPVRLDRPSTLRDSLRNGTVSAGAGLSDYVVAQAAQTEARYLSRLVASTRNYPFVLTCRSSLLDELSPGDVAVIQQIGTEMSGEADLRWTRDQHDDELVQHATAAAMIDAGHASVDLRCALQGAMLESWYDACRGLNAVGRRYFNDLRDRIAA